PEARAALRAELGGVPLMCTVPVRGPEAIDVARRYAPVADYLLLDSTDEATGTTGATGLTHDWRVSARIVETVAVPVVLAGGLGPENVVAALDIVRPWGVDSDTH